MDITIWFTYIGVITVLIAIPGPSSLLIILHGYKYGFKKANNTIIGNLMGSLVLMFVSVLGLGVILTSSEIAFSMSKYIGSLFLLYLGIKTILNTTIRKQIMLEEPTCSSSSMSLLKLGFLTGVSNPKDLLFFAALFPAFLNPDGSLLFQFSVLMLTWLSIDYLLKFSYMLVGKKLSSQFNKPNFLTLFNRFIGVIFISFAIFLASSSR